MSWWPSVDLRRAPRGRRPDDRHPTPPAARARAAASGGGSGENHQQLLEAGTGHDELGWRAPSPAGPAGFDFAEWSQPQVVPRQHDPFPWTSMPWTRLTDVAPSHGGWRPPATAHPEVLEPDRDVDGRGSCLPLVREAGLRVAAGDTATNFVVSPLSIHAALALVAAGARGDTQRELLSFLGAGSLAELLRAGSTQLVTRLRRLPQTSFACGVWVGGPTSLLNPEFMEAAASRYAAVAEAVDFAGAPEEARARVNAFVSDATNGLIRDVLPPGSVQPSTVVVLANALYFKGKWALPFEPYRTFHAPFHLVDGVTTVPVPFMTTSLFEQRVAVFTGFKTLKLPYTNAPGPGPHPHHQAAASFYMLILLPDGGKAVTIGDLYDKVASTPGFIRKHTPVDEVPVGRFMVPKFKFTYKFEASEDMKRLGVTSAFGGGDFSGMLVSGGDELFIDGVYHKATIEVDEQGTVAAAATAVCMHQCAKAPRLPVDFVADRPFLFAIVEERTGAVMFIGHVANPLLE